MGSPYSVSISAKSIHTVKTTRGFTKVFELVAQSMNFSVTSRGDRVVCRYAIGVLAGNPEYRVLNDLYSVFQMCLSKRTRKVVTLEARYDWTGYEKFGRTIVFDFTSSLENPDSFGPLSCENRINVAEATWEDLDQLDWSSSTPLSAEWLDYQYDFK